MLELIVAAIAGILNKVIPDKAKQVEAQIELAKLAASGEIEKIKAELQVAVGQLTVNNTEASSENLFKSGWRPFIAWSFGIGVVFTNILFPLIVWILQLIGLQVPPPPLLDSGELMAVISGILGLGVMRSYEKRIK